MEINTIVQRYIPEKPKVIASEQIEVYVPTANYNYPGLASFDSRGFIVDVNGKVKLRRDSLRNVKDFTIDVTTGECTIYYDDGTEATVKFPTNSETLYNRVGLMTTIDVKGSSFVRYELSEQEVEWYLILPNTSTGFNNDKYLVSFEESGNIDYAKPNETSNLKVGYFTINDSIFKGSDGSLLISIDDEYYSKDFSGRLLLLGGEIFTDTQIVNITYSPDKHKLSIFKTDGTVEIINAVTKDYVDDYIKEQLSTVYHLEGVILFDELPDISEMDKYWVGKVWYVRDEFITDERFVEGAYATVAAGTNVTVVETDEGLRYDILGSLIDLSLYYTKDEVDAIAKHIPLTSSTIFEYTEKTYDDLRSLVGGGELWDERVPFSQFNRVPETGDIFFAIGKSTVDNRHFTLTGEITGRAPIGIPEAYYKLKEIVLLDEYALFIKRTVFLNTDVGTFNNTDEEDNFTYTGNLKKDLFSLTPVKGNEFFGTAKLNDGSVATFAAIVTDTFDTHVSFKLSNATTVHRGSLDTTVNQLVSSYVSLSSTVDTLVNTTIKSTEKGAFGGVATLSEETGKIPKSQLPFNIDDYVLNTKLAKYLEPGLIASGEKNYYGFFVSAAGLPYTAVYSEIEYKNNNQTGMFIGKGTLENIKNDLVKRAIIDYAAINAEALAANNNEYSLSYEDMRNICQLFGALVKPSLATGGEQVVTYNPRDGSSDYRGITFGNSTVPGNFSFTLTDGNGRIAVNEPELEKQAANKKYVDDNKGTKLYKHTVVLREATIVIVDTNANAYDNTINLDTVFTNSLKAYFLGNMILGFNQNGLTSYVMYFLNTSFTSSNLAITTDVVTDTVTDF